MSMHDALLLAEKGFHVFPLQPNSKLPAIDDYPNQATRDPKKIKSWWLDPVLEIEQPYNVGISTSRYGDDEALVVVDVDNKEKKKGNESVLKMELEGLDFPDTFEQETPSGGRHLVYRVPKPLNQGSANKLGPGVDVRSRGGYIVGAGSTVAAGRYALVDKPLAPTPAWIVQRLGESKPKKKTVAPPGIDAEQARARAVDYLERQAPISKQGDGGDSTAFKVAAQLKDFGVEPLVALEIMFNHWNGRCEPPWSIDELTKKIENAYTYGHDTVGSAAPEADFKPVPDQEKFYLDAINEKFALVYLDDSHYILHETVTSKGRPKLRYLSESTFRRKFSTRTVQATHRGKNLSQAEVWLDWKGRREYEGVTFTPEREAGFGYYNLWSGFACKQTRVKDASLEARLGFTMFMEHAKENVCGNDEKLFQWLMGFFAQLIQHPYQRSLTTIVFKGRKGTGKNALVDRVGRLLGKNHYLVAQNSRYLTSNFNGHLELCLMLVLDEAFWSGDKSADGILKGMTTAPEILIERKGREPYQVDNLARLAIIGNEDWLIPASADERRYAVFEMGERRRKDGAFFEKMRILMDEKGGCEVLLDYLKNFDLSKVDVNDAPATQALFDQKVLSAEPLEQWWYQSLRTGHLMFTDFQSSEWLQRIDKEAFRTAFKRYLHDRNIKSAWTPDEITIGRKLKKFSPSSVSNQKRRDGYNTIGVYDFQDLATVRKEFEAYMGHEVKWE